MRFEFAVAWRYFLSGRSQTLLTIAGVTVGVTILIFISALIRGLRKTMVTQVLGTVTPVVVKPPLPRPRALPPVDDHRPPTTDHRPPLARNPARRDVSPLRRGERGPGERSDHVANDAHLAELNLATAERSGREREQIRNWRRLEATLRGLPGVTAVSPIVEGSAFAVAGATRRPVLLRGVTSESQHQIVPIASHLSAGTFELSSNRAVIGRDLTQALGVHVGGRIRLTSSQLRTETYTVAGIFDLGFANLNERWVFISRSSAQRLLDLGGSVTSLELQIPNFFAADELADRAALVTGMRAISWSRADPEFLALLQIQSASSLLVQGFILVAVAFGIASVLVVAVLQRGRDIGILRSMGTEARSIATIFMVQAGLVGTTGALFGTGLGVTLSLLLTQISGRTAGGHRLFPIELQVNDVSLIAAAAVLASLVAGFVPAQRAAALDPVEVIHHG